MDEVAAAADDIMAEAGELEGSESEDNDAAALAALDEARPRAVGSAGAPAPAFEEVPSAVWSSGWHQVVSRPWKRPRRR